MAMAQDDIAPEAVLSTLNRDGSRRWLTPKLSRGRFLSARRWVGWGLIVLFVALPWLRVGGRPAFLLDIPRRQLSFFGSMFYATDVALLMLLLLAIFLFIFWITALFGRVWCGWGCPQTVYMELLFRPLERLFDGKRGRHGRYRALRRLAKYIVFVALAAGLAHTFLAYFVGVDALERWVRQSPFEHPGPFLVMAITTALVLADFAYFREQMCTVMCPYARFQSVLLDRHSLIIGYDARRGEPRRKLAEQRALTRRGEDPGGDCIDCRACVVTCPTGIDIRSGLQLECIACAQCIDACDAIMDRVQKPRGLIRYSSQAALEVGAPRKLVRPRTLAYPVLVAVIVGMLASFLAGRGVAEVTVLRGIGAPFIVEPDGRIANQIRVRIENHQSHPASFLISLEGNDTTLIAPQNPLPVAAEGHAETSIFVASPADSFADGSRAIELRIESDGFLVRQPYRLLGPQGATGKGGI